jgi:transcriptional regulator with XRE-family HTH domain
MIANNITSYEKLAQATNTSKATVNNAFQGKRLGSELLAKLCILFNIVSLDAIAEIKQKEKK